MKTCKYCNIAKPFCLFGLDKSKKDQYNIYCKECVRKKTKIYKEKYPSKAKEAIRKWKVTNITSVREYRKKYYQTNMSIEKQASKEYRKQNRQNIAKKEKEYRDKNRTIYLEKKKQYFQKNKHKHAKYVRDRRLYDSSYRLVLSLRDRVRHAINGNNKSAHTLALLGCSVDQLWTHLEKQFTEGMTRDNHGRNGWHIDHIIPCSSFDLRDPEQQRKCFHYSNLQPLWADDNIKKSNKIVWQNIM